MRRRADLLAAVALVLIAVAYTLRVTWRQATTDQILASYDIYAAHYPSVLYALRSLRAGYGLLWNPFQNCGQPFLPSTLVGLFYPLNAVFLLFHPDTAYYVIVAVHLALGGVFAFFLCREYGLGAIGALSGALAFMLGGSTLALAGWLPSTILGPYVWMPAALWTAERTLKTPTSGHAIALGVCLTLGLLPGYPQILVFTYQLIALRAVWELATNRAVRRPAVVGALALGLVLPAFLGAVCLLPSIEFVRESIRGQALTLKEIQPMDRVDIWREFRRDAGVMTNSFLPIFTLVPTAVAALALLDRRHWRLTAFYALATALLMLLAFNAQVFEWYRSLPLGNTFREPHRFIWVVSFTASVLVGIGADRAARDAPRSVARALLFAAAIGLGAFLFSGVCLRPFSRLEWRLLGFALVVVVAGALLPRTRPGVACALPVILGTNLFILGSGPFAHRLANGWEIFHRHADVFAFVRERMSPLDREYHFGEHQDYSLTSKLASVYGVPTIDDYEPQTSRRFAELTVDLFQKMRMTTVNFFMYRLNATPLRWPLFDLLGARYLVMDPAGNRFRAPLKPSLREIRTEGKIRILENPDAYPRAFWVPALEVVPDPVKLVERLGADGQDLRRVALVDGPPPDGFLGRRDAGSGEVTSFTDRAETVTLDVRADADGFVVLTDQYYPGWETTVNGAPASILRANYAFRAVRVPRGASHVVFRYRPRSVWWGAVISMLTAAALGVFAGRRVVRR